MTARIRQPPKCMTAYCIGTIIDGRRTVNRLFSVDVADAAVEEIYQGGFDAPTALLGSGQDFAVSPDGREVCFS